MPACQPLGPSVGLTCRKAGEALPRSRPNQPASPACSLPAPLARTPRGTFGWGGKAGGSAVLGGARAHPESARERARDLSAPEKANVESWALLVGRQGEEGKKERKKEREKARLNESEMSPACIPQREQEIPFLAHVDLEWREMTRLI